MGTKPSTRNIFKKIGEVITSDTARRWIQKALILVLFSLVVNHLAHRDSFPDGESYRFPVEGFVSSIVLCIVIGFITYFNFKRYQNKYFFKKVEAATIIKFMASTLGYIVVFYIPVNLLLNVIVGAETEFYYIVIGLLITLLVSFIFIGLWYAQDIYDLYQSSIKDAELTIASGAKMTKLTYEDIACFYSENKIVYTVQNDGATLTTDFTLNELEETINDQLFFRANRQMIIHKDAVDQIEKIENGKLRIRLKASLHNDAIGQITISRYKRKVFMDWYT
ncbi:LytR/AlgR family response regulator transcription factor [Aquimarina brevivitae]|uniref:LytTr DNA-binding domain-containing protein n=1 Tax=Aquimarina brevivitae TaxID=323412 RepID=A0A4Q7PIQ8_9FLAO|nr:LytTR family DNA-binding domain-containing protein [Aquimarina brevivitae]RZT00148.1 LytTr DNA-binding domain-containing protein [Aquimarina brevivitae]